MIVALAAVETLGKAHLRRRQVEGFGEPDQTDHHVGRGPGGQPPDLLLGALVLADLAKGQGAARPGKRTRT